MRGEHSKRIGALHPATIQHSVGTLSGGGKSTLRSDIKAMGIEQGERSQRGKVQD